MLLFHASLCPPCRRRPHRCVTFLRLLLLKFFLVVVVLPYGTGGFNVVPQFQSQHQLLLYKLDFCTPSQTPLTTWVSTFQSRDYRGCCDILRNSNRNTVDGNDDISNVHQPQLSQQHQQQRLRQTNKFSSLLHSRRDTLLVGTTTSALAAAAAVGTTAKAASTSASVDRVTSVASTTALNNNVYCLQDLPPFDPTTTIRLYLCRHGETEYNRLQLVQGSRIDAPLNNRGIQQAQLLGQALANAAPIGRPDIIFHSPLQRAQSTAQYAASQFSTRSPATTTTTTTTPWRNRQNGPTTRSLATLAEVDFGPTAEGQPVAERRQQLLALYSSWAMGNLDARMDGNVNSESGRQILERIDRALRTMIAVAATESKSGCIAAVSHSSYLRLLLLGNVQGFVGFTPTLYLANCCINVVDFDRPPAVVQQQQRLQTTAQSSMLLALNDSNGAIGGRRSLLSPSESKVYNNDSNNNNALSVVDPSTGTSSPLKGRVIRINETRHLASLPSRVSSLAPTN